MLVYLCSGKCRIPIYMSRFFDAQVGNMCKRVLVPVLVCVCVCACVSIMYMSLLITDCNACKSSRASTFKIVLLET